MENWSDWEDIGHIKSGVSECPECNKFICEECKKGYVHKHESNLSYGFGDDWVDDCTPYYICDNCNYFLDSI